MRYVLYLVGTLAIALAALLFGSSFDSPSACQGLGADCRNAFSSARAMLAAMWAGGGLVLLGFAALIGSVQKGFARLASALEGNK
jgi:hypothetical protein